MAVHNPMLACQLLSLLWLLCVHVVSGSGIVAGSTKKGVCFGSDSSADSARCADLRTFNIRYTPPVHTITSCAQQDPLTLL